MSTEKILILSAVAFFTSFLVTPWARKVSKRWGMVDIPNHRKVHKEAVPYGGGIAIFLGFLAAFLLLNRFSTPLAGFTIGAFIIILLGIADDMFGLSALPKFIVQSLAAIVLIFFGIKIDMTVLLSGKVAGFSYLSIPVTYLWIVGITNAINIIDGLDGLAAGVSTISAFTVAAVAFINGQTTYGVLALIIGFAALGFLPHNFGSKIFMGDSGSMFLGYSLAALSLLASVKLAAAFSLFVPLMILAIPIFDTVFAILRRVITKKSIFEGDRKHLHHRLIDMGFTPLQTVMFIYFLSVVFGGLALYSSVVRPRTGYILFAISLLFIMMLTVGVTIFHEKKTRR